MGRIGKSFASILILIIAISSLSLLMVKSVCAQSIPAPSAPTFTVQYVVYASYVAPTYTISPYTGQNETISSGGQVNNETIEFTIKNQPFTPYIDSSGNYIALYYNFEYKGHFGSEWTPFPFGETGQGTWQSTWREGPSYSASKSDFTIISINFDYFYLESAPAGSQVDFQVQAVTGHINPITSGPIAGEGYYNFTGQSSDWSNTKTVTINYGSNSTVSSTSTNQTISPPPTPTHPISEFSTWIILPLFAVIMLLSIVFARKRPLK